MKERILFLKLKMKKAKLYKINRLKKISSIYNINIRKFLN